MLISNDLAARRLASPMNLINRLRNAPENSRKNAMSLFVAHKEPVIPQSIQPKPILFNPFENLPVIPEIPQVPQVPTANDVLDKDDIELKLGLAHNKALDVLTKAVDRLGNEVDSIAAGKLPAVITATSKVVEGIRRERLERDKNNKDREVHYHFYTPEQKKLVDYAVIDVTP